MKESKAVNFPQNVPFGTTHYELGRTWEFVSPGMWRSIGGSGGGGGGGTAGDVYWDDILGKPVQIKNLAAENSGKVSMISGGSY
jgi:hypothetical protein